MVFFDSARMIEYIYIYIYIINYKIIALTVKETLKVICR